MNELKFNSAVCTTKEQSQRLLELGLKPETADMGHFFDDRNDYPFFHHWKCSPYKWYEESLVNSENIPAWSLHRLLLMTYPKEDCYPIMPTTAYDDIIDEIENVIKCDGFNKEYLKQ